MNNRTNADVPEDNPNESLPLQWWLQKLNDIQTEIGDTSKEVEKVRTEIANKTGSIETSIQSVRSEIADKTGTINTSIANIQADISRMANKLIYTLAVSIPLGLWAIVQLVGYFNE